MTLLDKYKKIRSFQVGKPKKDVAIDINKAAKNCTMIGDSIQIIIKPSFVDPFAGRGIISLHLDSINNDTKTMIVCEIVPTSITKSGLYLMAIFLSLLTVFGLSISLSFYSFLTIVLGWTLMIFVLHLTQVLCRGKLENYVVFLLSNIEPVRQKSFA